MGVFGEDHQRVRGQVGQALGAHLLEGGSFGVAQTMGGGEGVGLSLVAAGDDIGGDVQQQAQRRIDERKDGQVHVEGGRLAARSRS